MSRYKAQCFHHLKNTGVHVCPEHLRENIFYSYQHAYPQLNDWKLVFVDTPRLNRLGNADTTRKIIHMDVRAFDLDAAHTLDVLRHEIAHALDPLDYLNACMPKRDREIHREVYGAKCTVRNVFRNLVHSISWARIAINLGCLLKYATAGYDLEILRYAKREAKQK